VVVTGKGGGGAVRGERESTHREPKPQYLSPPKRFAAWKAVEGAVKQVILLHLRRCPKGFQVHQQKRPYQGRYGRGESRHAEKFDKSIYMTFIGSCIPNRMLGKESILCRGKRLGGNLVESGGGEKVIGWHVARGTWFLNSLEGKRGR